MLGSALDFAIYTRCDLEQAISHLWFGPFHGLRFTIKQRDKIIFKFPPDSKNLVLEVVSGEQQPKRKCTLLVFTVAVIGIIWESFLKTQTSSYPVLMVCRLTLGKFSR